MRKVGTVVRGIRTPIIRENANLEDIVVNSLIEASKEENFEFRDRDIVAITEAVVGISEGNYVTVDQIVEDIHSKFDSRHLGLVFPILSRNRFSIILKSFARSFKPSGSVCNREAIWSIKAPVPPAQVPFILCSIDFPK